MEEMNEGNDESTPAGEGEPQPIVIHPELQGDGRPVGEPQLERRVQRRRATDTDMSVIPAGRLEPDGESFSPPELSSGEAKRALSLDALRGLFLLSMTFGFTIMSEKLPQWMYHRQMSPTDQFINVPGISWRDLAYVSFLFTMSAALPLTLTRRMDHGELEVGIIISMFRRFFMLFVFALLVGHSNTYFLGYTQPARVLAITGFVIMCLIFTRRRKDWNPTTYKLLNRFGWLAAIAFFAFSPLVYGKQFSLDRADDIIVGLAFAALTGSLTWYFTREKLQWRLAVLAGAAAMYLGSRNEGWLQEFWYSSSFPAIYQWSEISLLCIVIPGTIAGDHLLRWMKAPPEKQLAVPNWSNGRLTLLSAICLIITPLVVWGMYNRLVGVTTAAVFVLCICGTILVRSPRSSGENLIRQLFLWGTLWLMIGLFLEPSEGGIRKVPETLSYFFTVTGTTSLLLVAFAAIIDLLKKRRFISALIDLGHNPLLCYVLFTVFLNSLFELIPAVRPVLQGSPGESILRSILSTVLVVLIVRFATRRRIFWRT